MIDDPAEVDRVLAAMRANLPLAAETSADVASLLRRQAPGVHFPRRCRVDQVHYTGDEGGIVCHLDFGMAEAKHEYIVSITHIRFARSEPLGRAIAAYQKRRTKRLRRLAGR